jgi:alpha-galactosidase
MSNTSILTPKPSLNPRINGPKIFGVRPGSPLIFKISATGEKPLSYFAEDLPEGVRIDQKTGQILGVIKQIGVFNVKIRVSNARGAATRDFKIMCGDKICLTPPMGWNSWYVFSLLVTQDKIERMAKALAESGLIDHGWSYINIDDCWQGKRDPKTKRMFANDNFPDMKNLCDQIHRLGLKAGIYSTPWAGSYAGYYGGSIPNESCDMSEFEVPLQMRFEKNQVFGDLKETRKPARFFGKGCEEIDARQFAEWGFDYLKYDWNPNDVPHVTSMLNALRKTERDIVYSLSNHASFKLAKEWKKLANVWRTTGDIKDSWDSISNIGFNQDRWAPFGGPGHWNDPDMLQVGMTNTPHQKNPDARPTRLTPNEQYTQMTLWCLLAAPLLLSCDLEKLDEFTLSLLTNDEMIEINQDPLGISAHTIAKKRSWFSKSMWRIYARPLEDGSHAVGLFNLGDKSSLITVKWSALKIQGKKIVRDLWRQQDMGIYESDFTADVPPHGVVAVKIKSLK